MRIVTRLKKLRRLLNPSKTLHRWEMESIEEAREKTWDRFNELCYGGRRIAHKGKERCVNCGYDVKNAKAWR